MIDLGDWKEPLAPLFSDERYKKIRAFLLEEYRRHVVYPDMYDIFNCFRYTPFAQVKAVLLGQDPYHEPGQAHGLCFSVKDGVKKPPSLENMMKELHDDLGCPVVRSGDLTKWAREGVLLMNTALTVREHQANSHANCGWSWFTDAVISILSEQKEHLVLECAHPSPLSAYNGFFGCRHFSKTNAYLTAHGISPIDWDLSK